ncbi:MAG: DUF1700 domain-containing protein [Lachnospiraceae bacterium]|nr:DUF1700 domain-containing protein [Lachnospiraceae bacterium]
MEKTEFIERLQRALAAGVPSSQVAENVRYYQDYIDSEIRKGRSEKEVMESLGDPRLLAKSIIEANKHAGVSYGSNQEYDEEVAEDTQEWEPDQGAPKGRSIVLPGWLVMLIVTVIVLLIIGVVTYTLFYFAPVIIGVLVVVLIVKAFQGRSH